MSRKTDCHTCLSFDALEAREVMNTTPAFFAPRPPLIPPPPADPGVLVNPSVPAPGDVAHLPETVKATLTPDGVLRVTGTGSPDHIFVRRNAEYLSTLFGHAPAQNYSIDNVQIYVGGTYQPSVPTGSVKRFVIDGGDGRDVISLNTQGSLPALAPATVHGGAGSDDIYGGNGDDILYGDGGQDNLYGNGGNDWLYGGSVGRYDRDNLEERDRLDGGPGFNHYADAFDYSHAVYLGDRPTPADVQQRQSPTCQTLASLAAAVAQGFNVAARITPLSGYQYRVSLGGLAPQVVTFDGTWSDNDPKPATGPPEFYTVLVQRARLQAYGVDWSAPMTDAQWDAADDATGGKLLSSAQALRDITGRTTTVSKIDTADPQALAKALAQNRYVVASSVGDNKKDGLTADGIVRHHAYAVTAVAKVNGVWMVTLYNPWGTDRGDGTAVGAGADDGVITLTFQQFKSGSNFATYKVA